MRATKSLYRLETKARLCGGAHFVCGVPAAQLVVHSNELVIYIGYVYVKLTEIFLSLSHLRKVQLQLGLVTHF
jgi:hypothetical protein